MSGAGEHESRGAGANPLALCHRPGGFCKRQDLVGELRILAAEVMSRANLLARHARLMQTRTYAVLLAFAVNTQDGLLREVCQLPPRRQPLCVVAYPVSDADLE